MSIQVEVNLAIPRVKVPVLGENGSAACIPFAIAADIANGFFDTATFCDGEVTGNEVWLVNLHIGQYSHGNIMNHEPVRKRKLLLHRKEIDKMLRQTREKGLTLVPTKLYLKEGLIKVELAIGKGKKLHDKRDSERERETLAEAKAGMARRQRQ